MFDIMMRNKITKINKAKRTQLKIPENDITYLTTLEHDLKIIALNIMDPLIKIAGGSQHCFYLIPNVKSLTEKHVLNSSR